MTTIWYEHPARRWDEALPVGCGSLGAMVFGGLGEERLALNADTLWSGGPHDSSGVADGPRILAEVRERYAAEGDWAAAEDLTRRLQGPDSESYQPLGDLWLRHTAAETETEPAPGDGYRRWLDLRSGIASVACPGRGIERRDVLASYPDQVIMVRIQAAAGHTLEFEIGFTSPHREVEGAVDRRGRLYATGRVPAHVDPPHHGYPDPVVYRDGEGMLFGIAVDVRTETGTVDIRDGALIVTGAHEATVLIAADTSFRGWRSVSGDDRSELIHRCTAVLDAAWERTPDGVARRHVEDHRGLFDRVELKLGTPDGDGIRADELPTDERLRRVRQGAVDPGLEALLFDYGRYLLIASSRPGTQAANLQGIWCEDVQPSWSCDYTTNINVQMNYWAAETVGLSECHLPLVDLVDALRESGAQTARTLYDCGGWVVHHNADLWKVSWPVRGEPLCTMWPMGAAWLCRHLVDHAEFSVDADFLERRAWPAVRDAARFLLDFLIEDDDGQLVTFPSTSPENTFLDVDGRRRCLDAAPAMDRWILRELFGSVLEIARRTGLGEEGFVDEVRGALKRIPEPQVGPDGRLLEWSAPYDEYEPGHRHVSHLYGLYPGDEIDVELTPDLALAARASLDHRLAHDGGGTGWSSAWAVCLWARLGDGQGAHESVHHLLADHVAPNLLGLHPPHIFQIDANLGYTAGVAEMLVQSHRSTLRLLPALPTAWPDGQVRGLRARGGVAVDLSWAGGRLVEATLTGDQSDQLSLKCPDNVRLVGATVDKGRTLMRFAAV